MSSTSRFWDRSAYESGSVPHLSGTEEVVYLSVGDRDQYLGLRPADGGEYRYYEVGREHLAFCLDTRAEVDAVYRHCVEIGAKVQFPPEEDRDIEGFYETFVFDPDGHRIEIACRQLRRPTRHRAKGQTS